jgi:hypothetical protein
MKAILGSKDMSKCKRRTKAGAMRRLDEARTEHQCKLTVKEDKYWKVGQLWGIFFWLILNFIPDYYSHKLIH